MFNGSMLYYSYDSCGNAPDCYHDFWQDLRCPYDPYGSKSYKVHKPDGCECLFHGLELPPETFLLDADADSDTSEIFGNTSFARIYGTTCAAWDQMPGSPWAEHCPRDADWCHSEHNWCQLPWCYVSEACETKMSSTFFDNASTVAFYSYNTCLDSPSCRSMPFDASCPFDSRDIHWPTAVECPDSWSDVCECQFQGSVLPESLFTQFPTEEPRRFAHMPNIGVYGTTCAAWDQVPGTPCQADVRRVLIGRVPTSIGASYHGVMSPLSVRRGFQLEFSNGSMAYTKLRYMWKCTRLLQSFPLGSSVPLRSARRQHFQDSQECGVRLLVSWVTATANSLQPASLNRSWQICKPHLHQHLRYYLCGMGPNAWKSLGQALST